MTDLAQFVELFEIRAKFAVSEIEARVWRDAAEIVRRVELAELAAHAPQGSAARPAVFPFSARIRGGPPGSSATPAVACRQGRAARR